MKLEKIKNALISVSNKEGLDEICKILNRFNINIISSGGTFRYISKLGFRCTEISKYTGFKEMLDGRVKTLHPKIHAGILHNRSKKHFKEMKGKKFPSIDLIIVNFYPFQKIIKSHKNINRIIDNIDIGGPTLVRAAAKNFKNVCILTNTKQYKNFIKEIKLYKGKTTLNFRELMSSDAFGLTAYYDAIISDWFNKKLKIDFPERKAIFAKKLEKLSYGENPHQKSAIYISDYDDDNLNLKKLSGKKLSYNNYSDIYSSLDILSSFSKKPTTVVVKHSNPCGISSDNNLFSSLVNAYDCDPVSAFGGIVACNFKINKKIANFLKGKFIEVILAKGFDKDSLRILRSKKNLRIIDISGFKTKNKTEIKIDHNVLFIQDKNKILIEKKKLGYVTKNKPNKKEMKYLEFAFNCCKHVKSNAIVITKAFSTIGIGAGQPSRLDSSKIAAEKAKKFHKKKLKNAVAASDGFFPFADSIKNLVKSGVKTIIQPGGSIRDKEVIDAANKAKVKMIFTGTRHFKH
tara:strand:- start:1649 stop:3199 length:1551 start_codon:yes stop_codon:yes gene_type:complete